MAQPPLLGAVTVASCGLDRAAGSPAGCGVHVLLISPRGLFTGHFTASGLEGPGLSPGAGGLPPVPASSCWLGGLQLGLHLCHPAPHCPLRTQP